MNGDFRRAIVWGPLRRKSRAAPHVFVVLSLVLSTSALLGFSSVSSASEVVAQINFQPKDSVVPFGYRSDYGEAFDSKRGYGWIDQNKNKPASIVGNGRERNLDGDQRRDTLMYMQYKGSEPGSVAKSARWQYAIASGTYDVRVTVGDPLLTENSVHRVVVEGVVAIPSFTPTSDNRFAMGSVRVQVSDGRLTLNAAGGVNTKINYVDIVKASTDSAPHVVDVDPASGAPNAPVTTSVTLSLSEAVDTATISSSTVKLLDPQGTQVAGSYNSDAVGSLISFTPTVRLLAQTTYTVRTTSGLIAASGQAFTPFSSAFTTGSGGVPPAPLEYDRLTVGDLTGPTTLTFGPDGKLYVATGIGQILRYTLGSNGLPVGPPETFDRWTNQRTITGLRFDPAASATNLKLWVSHGALGFEDMPNFTGKISVLSGATLQNARDVIVGLPRSTRDHLNNGIDFGPDGRLYLAQGSTTGYGAPDNFWGLRNEVPLSAAVLVANVNGDSRFQGTVDVDTSAGYDPNAAGAPVTVHASGTRNPFDLVWQTSGSLYAPVNESAGGNTPAGPTGTPPALYDLPAGRDFLARIRAGRYYGHPNPSRGQYVLNGGNPTSAVDPFEVPQYPVGQQPDARWDKPILDLGLHRSANGISEYTASAFADYLWGSLLVAEFSNGDDLIAVDIDAAGNAGAVSQIAAGFYNPLDVTVDAGNGNIYVAEYGSQPEGTGGKITLLRPVPPAGITTVDRVNFQKEAASVPPHYQRDFGEAYDATRGYGWVAQDSATPFSIKGNGRDRNAVADQRHDTFIHMDYSGSTGVAVPARWEHALPDGAYDVTVSVGDPIATDSIDRLTVEGKVAVDNFVPTSTNRFRVATVRVTVTDGRLTVDSAGGSNTKLNYVDIDRVT